MPNTRVRICPSAVAPSAAAVIAEELVKAPAAGVRLKILARLAGVGVLTRLEGRPLAQAASLLALLIRMSLPICDDLNGLAPPSSPVSDPAPSSWLNCPRCPPPLTRESTACHWALV